MSRLRKIFFAISIFGVGICAAIPFYRNGDTTSSASKQRPGAEVPWRGNGEWCQDWYAEYGREEATSNPLGPAVETRRVLRGGSFLYETQYARSAYRHRNFPVRRHDSYGFRVARTYSLSR